MADPMIKMQSLLPDTLPNKEPFRGELNTRTRSILAFRNKDK